MIIVSHTNMRVSAMIVVCIVFAAKNFVLHL